MSDSRRLMAVCLFACAALPAGAQGRRGPEQTAIRVLGGFLSTGGYAFTNGSARSALGDLQFYNSMAFYVRPKRYGDWQLSGGVQFTSTSDQFLPFSGGNTFSLIGPAFGFSRVRREGRVSPYITGGLFAGRVRSVNLGFDRTDFTPSLGVGLEYPFARYVTLYAGYRISESINGVNTDGFNFGFRLF